MPRPDNVVVIGGAGFIGSHLTAQLRETGCNVSVVSRTAGAGRSEEPGLRYLRAGVADESRMREVVDGASVVYHLAAGGGATWADYERDYVQGTRNVARACLDFGVRRLLFTSSISALYLGRHGKLDNSVRGDRRAQGRSFYSRAKVAAEDLLLGMHSTEKLPVVILRPGIVLGAGGMLVHGALGATISDICILGWGRGNNPLPCVLARDVASALVFAKDVPNIDGASFNLSGDIRPTAREFVQILRQRTRRNFRFYPRNVYMIAAADYSRSFMKKLVGKQDNQVPSYRDVRSLSMAADLDCTATRMALGWQPENDREAFLREAVDAHLEPIHPMDLRLQAVGAPLN